ncbi:PepSY domain-containing protein [Psychrobacillus sp.]|uniref:PepSY domain-containing protein n=1 Tax=Psychrobacillus sp. TaxID=1871623 RepID=UPI0028BD45C9|nr:PepSY domain-containing protein [Psychrobacillus sp.]
MKKKKWMWITGAILLIILLLSFGLRSFTPYFSAQALTEEEASKVVLEKYPGEIVKIAKIQDEYLIDIQLETGVYFIKIDAKTGDILSLELLKKAEEKIEEKAPEVKVPLSLKEIEQQMATQGELQSIESMEEKDSFYYKVIVHKDDEKVTLKVNPYTAEIMESSKEPIQTTSDTNKLITEKEAIAIAASYLKGVADDDVEFYQPTGKAPYYLVEVEVESEEEDREATVKIDAYTGVVKSFNWEN